MDARCRRVSRGRKHRAGGERVRRIVAAVAPIENCAVATRDQSVFPAWTEYGVTLESNTSPVVNHALRTAHYQECPLAISACRLVAIQGDLFAVIEHR